MHLSTVKVPIDFGIDWPRSSVLSLISDQLFISKLCISYSFASICIYLMRPSPVSVPHLTWLRIYTDSYACRQVPVMDHETVYLYILVRPLEFSQPRFGHWQWILQAAIGFAILYMLLISKFYMPTLINHRNSSKTVPISLYFVHIREHIDNLSILSVFQHGFRSGHSCVSVLLVTVHDFMTSFDRGIQTDFVVLDFSKAFDVVPHRRPLGKRKHYGITGPTLNWISEFLSGRTQCVDRGRI